MAYEAALFELQQVFYYTAVLQLSYMLTQV